MAALLEIKLPSNLPEAAAEVLNEKEKEILRILAKQKKVIDTISGVIKEAKFGFHEKLPAETLVLLGLWLYPSFQISAATLGKGMYGIVREGRITEDGPAVAIKTIKLLDRSKLGPTEILYEAIVLAKFRHPNIVAFYGVSLTKTHLHIAMELVPPTPKGDASDLFNLMQEAIDTQQTLENSIIRGILVDVLRALTALHTHVPAIVHRDVKPENVLVRENFSCALTDFGSAAPAGVRFSPAGTLHYMLPDATLVDAALDIYAFGVTAVQLICATGFLTAVDPKQVMTRGEISELTNTVLSSLSTPVCKALKTALLKPREITASELLKNLTVGKLMSSSHAAASTEMPTE